MSRFQLLQVSSLFSSSSTVNMMQIGSAAPAQNLHSFQAKPPTFRCWQATLRPITKPLNRSRSIELTRQHLSNLEKLLQKSNSEPQEVLIKNVSNNLPAENKGRGWLDGLSLARIWEEAKAVEEMSPRNLNRLQRLLSMSAERSPRNDLGSRWREYHGCNDWAGLIDPLNENLRREVVRYGEFVQAAYHAFHSDPATSPEVGPKHVALPDRSYKVTKSLYASSSVGLPKWVDDVAPDLGWMTQRSSWIGYVAVCDDKKEIQRMGRRDIVIALRGTATCLEWAENVRAQLVEIPNSENPTQKVECGFLNLHKTPGSQIPSLADSVVDEIRRLTDLYRGETLSITITGHSLGAALALLVGDEIATSVPDSPPIAVFSFGGPKVGNQSFADRLSSKSVKVLRIVNNQDIITRVPGVFVGEEDYSHVGTELKVDTKMSPYLKPNADVACCHDLEAYLHLVDGFLASNRPFRADAKRSLVKLLKDQGSNVKKLYTSRAKSLSLNPEKSGFFMAGCLPSPSEYCCYQYHHEKKLNHGNFFRNRG